MSGVYGETFLTRKRGRTLTYKEAEKKLWMYGPGEDGYRTSVLGMFNGLMNRLTGHAIACWREDDGRISGWKFWSKPGHGDSYLTPDDYVDKVIEIMKGDRS